MTKQLAKFHILFTLFLLAPAVLKCQETTRILFVFDASNSMNGYWGQERKIVTATKLLAASMHELEGKDNLELGLRVYGHQTKHVPGQQDCEDTELVVPIGKGTNLVINQELERIVPQGTTPIARSLEKAAGDFSDCDHCRNVIILITDGIEACDEDPCAVSRALQAKGIVLKPFIIGIGLDEKYKTTFECVGNYFDASKEETFKQVLDIVITQALNNTSVQINLLNSQHAPTESNVPISLYDQNTGVLLSQFVHTLNHKGNPDTLSLDPLPNYTVVAHTYPPVQISDVKIIPGQHNIIALETPQGDLSLSFDGLRSEYKDLKCLVRKKGECNPLNIQDFGTTERYITGDYNLEIQTVPATLIEGVNIAENHVTEVKIPLPGTLLLQAGTSGYGGIFYIDGNEISILHKFTFGDPSGRYVLQPGKYKVVFRSKNAKQSIYSIEKEFEIKSGTNTNLRI